MSRAWLFLSLTACLPLVACDDDDDNAGVADPSLTLTALNRCGGNYLPVPSREAFAEGNYEVITVSVKGRDPRTSSGYMLPGASVMLENGTGGTGEVYFNSSYQAALNGSQDAASKLKQSQTLAITAGEARDQIFCNKLGVVYLVARTEPGYQPGGTEPAGFFESSVYPIECISQEDYDARCDPNAGGFGGTGGAGNQGGTAGSGGNPDSDAGLPEEDSGVADVLPWTFANVPAASSNDLVIGTVGGTSGRPTSLLLSFLALKDGEPLPSVPVTFSLPENSPPEIMLEPSSGVTDHAGRVSTRLYAGGTPGVVSISATATYNEEELTARSETIVIRGSTPSMRSFNYSCEDRVIPAFTSRLEDGSWLLVDREGTKCNVQLADRVQGRIDTATQVFFLSEAGTMDETAATDANGRASSMLRVGWPAPVDVAPAGPSPKDGLVRLVAITRGEEDFIDVDGDKIYDLGVDEFIPGEHDLSDPFVDSNDNGEYDCGNDYCEEFRDADHRPGEEAKFSGPNGVWDGDTEIWKSTLVLWVGDIRAEEIFDRPGATTDSYISAQCGQGRNCSDSVPFNPNCSGANFYTNTGGLINISAYVVDQNGNCPNGYKSGRLSISFPNDYALVMGSDSNVLTYNERPFSSVAIENNHSKMELPCFIDRFENPGSAPANWYLVDKGTFVEGKLNDNTHEIEFPKEQRGDIAVTLSYRNAYNQDYSYSYLFPVCR